MDSHGVTRAALSAEGEGGMMAALCKQVRSRPLLIALSALGSRELGILVFRSTLTRYL